ncbi:MAG: FAD-dependent oxidoreductase [Chloroflexi bacterium]|nr:FAD-dependent oxidoreductase [Chloroflexota bacterium]
MADMQTTPLMRFMNGMASLAAHTWDIAPNLFPETLEVDENRSVWAAGTPDYQPLPHLQGVVEADLAIIGGGFTGTSTAYHFSRRFPEKRVVLLEAKSLGNGASGRNGGMILNWVNGVTYRSPEMTARIYQTTNAGIATIREIIDRHNLAVDSRFDGALTIYTKNERAEAAHREVEAHNAIGIPTVFIPASELSEQLRLNGACGAVLDPGTGQINGAQLVRGLRPVLLEQGVEIYENSPVIRIQEGSQITLRTLQGEVRAKAILLATNGYTSKLGYFRDALFPLHSHVFATAPLRPEQLQALGWNRYGAFSDDLDRISYASLTPQGHIVFGGGSNQSYAYLFNNRTAFPGAPDSAAGSFARIRKTLVGYMPGTTPLPIAYQWTGTLGITLDRNTLMGVRGEHRNVYYAIGYNGHGVTLANIAGQVITDIYSGDDATWRGLPFYQPAYKRIPPEPFRWIGYQMFTKLTGKSPRA